MTKTLNVPMIGGGFMGKAHAMAYAAMVGSDRAKRKVGALVGFSIATEATARFFPDTGRGPIRTGTSPPSDWSMSTTASATSTWET